MILETLVLAFDFVITHQQNAALLEADIRAPCVAELPDDLIAFCLPLRPVIRNRLPRRSLKRFDHLASIELCSFGMSWIFCDTDERARGDPPSGDHGGEG
jgi:hypothetical protein